MKLMFKQRALLLLIIISGLCFWTVRGDIDSKTPAKNSLLEKAFEADGSSQLIDRRSDLDDVDFSSFFDMDIEDDGDTTHHKDDSIANRSVGTQDSSLLVDSEGNQKNSTPSSDNKVVVGPYQVSVVDSTSPLLSSLGLKRKHLQHLTSSAYLPYSHRRSSYHSRYHLPHSFQTSESVRSSSYAEYPSQHPTNYGPPNSYPENRNKEYVPMGGHYTGYDREGPQDHAVPYAQKSNRPNSVDNVQPYAYGSHKPNYGPPPNSDRPNSVDNVQPYGPHKPSYGPHPNSAHQNTPSDGFQGGPDPKQDNVQPYGPHKPNYGPPPYTAPQNPPSDGYRGGPDPKQETLKRGPYGYAEPSHQPYGTDGQQSKDENRVPWRQTGQYPLHPSPLNHRSPPSSSASSYSRNKPYPSTSSSSRLQDKSPYPSSSYSRPAEVSQSYSKSQYGSPHDHHSYHSYEASRPHPSSHHHSPGSPKPKMPQRAGTVNYNSEGSYHSHHHSAAPSKPMITVKFKTRSPEGGHGLSIPLNFNPIEVVKKLATPLAAFNPLANKKVTIGITIENKNKHEGHSDILHSY